MSDPSQDAIDAERFRWCLAENPGLLAAIAWRYPIACQFADPVQAIDAARHRPNSSPTVMQSEVGTVMFDGPEAFASVDAAVARLNAEINAAGGLEAWQASIPNETVEIVLLRRVYEAARRFLRFNGIDQARVNAAVDQMDDAIEEVKQLDGGNYEPAESPFAGLTEYLTLLRANLTTGFAEMSPECKALAERISGWIAALAAQPTENPSEG